MKTVIVTGAAAGIGRACVETFQSAGFTVIGVDRHDTSPADDHMQIDLARPTCGDELTSALGDRTVSGLVNNAAAALDVPATAITADDFDRVMAINLRAPLLLAIAIRDKLAASGGFIVNVASVHAVATSENVAAYAASKGGLVSMTRALALEWAPDIRVNAVLPGAVSTDMLRQGLVRSGMTLDELARKHPLERVGEPAEIAQAALFLAANEFMTGSSMVVDGGATSRLSTE